MQHKDLWLNFPPHLPLPAVRSLSLLYILEEFIQGSEKIQNFIHQIKTDPSSLLACERFVKFFSIDSSVPQRGIFSDKLYFYSEILQNASNIKNSSLQEELHAIRKQVLDVRIQCIEWKKNIKFPGKISIIPAMLLSLQEKLTSFFFSFIPFLSEAKTDENVLLSLIENRHPLNEIIAPNSVEKILQTLFPNGHTHLRATIYEGFLKRGFSAFLSGKDRLIEEIKWDSMEEELEENGKNRAHSSSSL